MSDIIPNKLPKVALAFWGITRSLKYTIKSIKKNVFDELKIAGINYDVFIHTYKINNYVNKRANEKKGTKINHNEYKLLNPIDVIISNQDDVKKNLNMKSYRTHKDPWKSDYETVDNFICAMYSKNQVTELIEKNGVYDYIIFLRPDVKYLNKFDIKFFDIIDDNTICIPDFHNYGNFNDRFCLANFKNGLLYGKLFQFMLLFSQFNSLHAEKFNNYYMRYYYKLDIKLVPFYFNRVRADGHEKGDCIFPKNL